MTNGPFVPRRENFPPPQSDKTHSSCTYPQVDTLAQPQLDAPGQPLQLDTTTVNTHTKASPPLNQPSPQLVTIWPNYSPHATSIPHDCNLRGDSLTTHSGHRYVFNQSQSDKGTHSSPYVQSITLCMPRQIVTQASLHPPHKVATPTSGQAILVGSPNAVSLQISKKPKMDTHYDYTKDLLALRSAQSCSLKATLPKETASIFTTLKLDQWKKSLSQYPDKDFVKYITEGIAEGLCINGQHPFQ